MENTFLKDQQQIRNKNDDPNHSVHAFKNAFIILLVLITIVTGCKKSEIPFGALRHYQQTNLVADIAGYDAARIDPGLTNAWGIAVSPSGILWISANHAGTSVVYDKNGMQVIPAVAIPSSDPKGVGAPTGQVFNNTKGFVIPLNGNPSKFIFAGEDGTVSAWNGGSAAVVVADKSADDAVYKGIAMANDGADTFLYVANFKGRRVDVLDRHFSYVTGKPFLDPSIPNDYGPFNIRNIHGNLFVTYAKHLAPDNEDDEKGPGNGYVDIFSPAGNLIRRFATRGTLNSPWGIAEAQFGFCDVENAILIGNFGDGRINVFDDDGRFAGQLKDKNGNAISIDGLWALENNVTGADPAQLFFTAGPGGEEHGLFGYLKRN